MTESFDEINYSWDFLLHNCKQTGMEAIERLRFLASFGPPGTGKKKGGKKMQPFNRFHSHPGNTDHNLYSVTLVVWHKVPSAGGPLL